MDARRDDSRRRHGRCPPHYARYACGTFFGVPPTGKTIAVQAMSFHRLSSGQFIEERGQPDLLSVAPANCRCAYSGWQRLRIASDNGEYQAAFSRVPARAGATHKGNETYLRGLARSNARRHFPDRGIWGVGDAWQVLRRICRRRWSCTMLVRGRSDASRMNCPRYS
jgi:hypothetical protein